MITTFIFPSRYVQGAHGLALLGEETKRNGEKPLPVLDPFVMDEMRRQIVEPLIYFCLNVGLPVTLEEIGRNSICQGQHLEIAIGAYVLGETIHNEPHDVAAERVVWALKAADAEGRRRKAMHEDEEVFMALAAV